MQKIIPVIKLMAVIGAILAISLSAASCVGPKKAKWTTQFEADAARDTIRADLAAAQAALIEEQRKLLARQDSSLNELKEMSRLIRADQSVQLNDIIRKVSAIERNISESQSRISSLDKKTSELSSSIKQKLASEEDAANQRKVQVEKLFEIAMSDFNAGRYDLAISGFTDFAKQFPDAPQTPEAEYWIAESRFAKKEYDVAEKEYMQLIKKYPEGAKSCAVFYKLGLVYEHLDKKKSMEMVWNNLLQRCPDTEEAQSVKSRRQ